MTKRVEKVYAKIAQAYADEFYDDDSDLPLIDRLASHLQPYAKVLDVGCGPGQFSRYLFDKDFGVEGIDSSEEMLAIARERVPEITFKQMDMRNLDYADGVFDGALVAYSIIHIPTTELETTLLEIKRVLKKGGFAQFIVQEGEGDQMLDEPLAKGEKIFMNFFSEERIAAALEHAGFQIIDQAKIEQNSTMALSVSAIGTLVRC